MKTATIFLLATSISFKASCATAKPMNTKKEKSAKGLFIEAILRTEDDEETKG